MPNAWSSPVSDVLSGLYSDANGLSEPNARQRLLKRVPEERIPLQLNSFTLWLLFAGALISLALGHISEGILMALALAACASFHVWHHRKAERIRQSLRRRLALRARVLRGGGEAGLDAEVLVPGDIILLGKGDVVPADARIIDSSLLRVEEAGQPKNKSPAPVADDAPVSERSSMLYAGAVVIKGSCKAVVVDKANPPALTTSDGALDEIARTGHFLSLAVLIVCGMVFVAKSAIQGSVVSFAYAVALAVAAMPGSMSASAASLALGAERMMQRRALVRRMQAIDALAKCDVICTGKTGILTHGEMTVREIFADNRRITVTGHGLSPEGLFMSGSKKTDPARLRMLLTIAANCNDARLEQRNGRWEITGDTTEGALLVAAHKAKIAVPALERVDELPFDPERRLMTTLHRDKGLTALTKGAPEPLLERCSRMLLGGRVISLSEAARQRIIKANLDMASAGLRVLGFAYKKVQGKKSIETGMVFAGLMALSDPPRAEAREHIRLCANAGIRVVMMTGDQKATAVAVGRELGLGGDRVLAGTELERVDRLGGLVQGVSIYAGVSSSQKLRVLNALKSQGLVVAMAGNSPHDVVPMHRADIRVSTQNSSGAVMREGDIVLADGSFSSLVSAVEEARGTQRNIGHLLGFRLSSGLGILLVVLASLFVGFMAGQPLVPLTVFQLLWICILVCSFPAIGLGMEHAAKLGAVQVRPMLSAGFIAGTLSIAALISGGTLFVYFLSRGITESYAVTMAFSTLVLFLLSNALIRSRPNAYLVKASILFLVLQALFVYAGGIPHAAFLGTEAIGIGSWLVVFAVALTLPVFELVRRRRWQS